MAKSKKLKAASLLILSLILIVGFAANEGTNTGQSSSVKDTVSTDASFSPNFNGITYSSSGSPRMVSESLYGSKLGTKQNISGAETGTLGMDIPGGWYPTGLSTKIYNLFANRSYTRNSNFSSGSAGYPYYWTNKTSTAVKTGWENTTAHDVYIYILNGQSLSRSDFGRWNQTIYINGTNIKQAKLTFRIRTAGTLSATGLQRTHAYVYINQTLVFNMTYSVIQPSYTWQTINLANNISTVPAVVNLTLKMGFTGGGTFSPTGNGYIYFDDVNLYVNCTVAPASVGLKLNGQSVSGQGYGQGLVHLQGSLGMSFVFSSDQTSGSVNFTCDSAIEITRVSPSGLVSYNVTQGSAVYYNVTKSSNFTSTSSWTYLSTVYSVDILNVSLPIDWVYDRLIRPDGLVEANSSSQVRIWNNNSYNWAVMVNVTAINSYLPGPYLVVAHAPNYLVSINAYRSRGSGWTASSLFTNGSRIMINATVQGGAASHGSAYVVFYNASSYIVWRDMSPYSAALGSNGIASFNFGWSSSNVTTSGLVTAVLWSNSSEVGVNWIPITFDLTTPKVGLTLPNSSQLVGGTVNIGVSSIDVNPHNLTLSINGIQVGTWSSTSASYAWNTVAYQDGTVPLTVTAWDQVDHRNATTWQVTIDNTPPSMTVNLPANYSYIHQIVQLTASFSDAHPINVTIYVNGSWQSMSTSGSTAFSWHTATHPDGVAEVDVISWDQVGNFRKITSFIYVDNTAPVLSMSPALNQYVSGNITMNIACMDANFKNVTLLIGGVSAQSWVYYNPSFRWNTTTYPDGFYALALKGWDLAGNENQTTMMTVYVDNTAPSVPMLVYPNDEDEFNSTTLGHPISWYAASDAGSGVDHYVLQLDTSPSFNSVNLRTIDHLTVTTYSIPSDSPLSNGTWYWRVSAVDAVGNAGAFSQPRSFQVIVKLAPPSEGLPVPILVGLLGGIPALAILSSVVLLRKRKRDAESAEYDVKNIMAAYVFSSDGRAMFSHPFTETRVDPQLLSGILTAISEVMKEVVGGDRRPLSTIERSDAKVIVEFGSAVMGALVAKKASREYRRRLRAFLARFEDVYGDKLAKWDGNESIFQAAPEIIEEIFCASAKVTTYPTITGLEDLLASGKLGGVAVSVAGKTGSGKTEFCLRYAASLLKRGNAVIAFAASIPPKEIREQLKSNGVDVEKVQEKGVLIIYDAYSGVSGLKSEEKYKFGSPGELNNINLALSRNLGKLEKATIFFDSLSTMIDYSDLELAVDFVRTVKVKLQQGGHVAFFIIDSNAHDEKTLNYILHVMDGEIETITETKEKGELERLVSFKRLKGFQVKPGYHELR